MAWARVSPAVFPPTFGRTARRPLSSSPPAGRSNERKWARRRQSRGSGPGRPRKSPLFHVKRSRKPLEEKRRKGKILYPLLEPGGPLGERRWPSGGLFSQPPQGLQQIVEVIHAVILDLNAALLPAVGDVAGPAKPVGELPLRLRHVVDGGGGLLL